MPSAARRCSSYVDVLERLMIGWLDHNQKSFQEELQRPETEMFSVMSNPFCPEHRRRPTPIRSCYTDGGCLREPSFRRTLSCTLVVACNFRFHYLDATDRSRDDNELGMLCYRRWRHQAGNRRRVTSTSPRLLHTQADTTIRSILLVMCIILCFLTIFWNKCFGRILLFQSYLVEAKPGKGRRSQYWSPDFFLKIQRWNMRFFGAFCAFVTNEESPFGFRNVIIFIGFGQSLNIALETERIQLHYSQQQVFLLSYV